MKHTQPIQPALTPLWWFFGTSVTAVATCLLWAPSVGSGLTIVIAFIGFSALAGGLIFSGRRRICFLLIAGLALGSWRGLDEASQQRDREIFLNDDSPRVLRVEATILEGWSRTRWGSRTMVRLHLNHQEDELVQLPRRCRLEVRSSSLTSLPAPGSTLKTIASLRGTADRPLLVVSSALLLEEMGPPSGLSSLREKLVQSLLTASGTDASRIRAAELAAALTLGRRDLLPYHRRDGWRRSGLGHALAVSGLHVGVVAGVAWFFALAAGFSPLSTRLVLLVLVPAYILLAGSSPSAVRAGIMICLYLGARLAGRAVSALATVMSAATLMTLFQPWLVLQAGFQLTVLVTAALIRWAPALTARLRGPRWFAAALAIPVVAQVAAAPLIGAHFRHAVPLAAGVNLAVPYLLTPAIPTSILATALASFWPAAAAICLDVLLFLTDALWWVGGLGRSWAIVVPAVSELQVILLSLAAFLALRFDRLGLLGAGSWVIVTLGTTLFSLMAQPVRNQVELLPVNDGLAATVLSRETITLFDGGRFHSEAAELLSDERIRRLDFVFASHGDEDHLGGLTTVLQSKNVSHLVVPNWLLKSEEVVDLLRAARKDRTRIVPSARGSVLSRGEIRFSTLWPPAPSPAGSNNDRSMIVRVEWPSATVLLTGDAGSDVERQLVAGSYLKSDVLVVPHHGSRSSSSPLFLDAVNPHIALIPAGAGNRFKHPNPEVLERLSSRGIDLRFPLRDGRCGARLEEGTWILWPLA